MYDVPLSQPAVAESLTGGRDMGCFGSDTVLLLLDGGLQGDALAQVENHLATCGACADRVALAAGGRPLTQGLGGGQGAVTLARGASIGRYVTIDLIGRGGMGEVYVAYDPQLDRKVALKLLHQQAASTDSSARARLLREAKAMARLSNPNVVVLHDAGEIDGRVFLAMEFIDGQTLAAWLRETRRGWREVRDVFTAAARGLGAAHGAGLVHRDFKPQNVMVGRDGSVRVMDFGLASDAQSSERDAGVTVDAISPVSEFTAGLTRSGILLGTPLYMAPEQFRGHRTDARTDQFSFCVSLYQALYGERPFDGGTMGAVAEAVVAGRVRDPPQKSQVPTRIRRAVLRGLRADPDDRFPSMSALIGALDYDPKRQYRRLGAALGVAGVLAAGMLGMQATERRGEQTCRGAAGHLAGVWESPVGPRRAAVERAFMTTRRPFAAQTWKQVAGVLDQYATRWTAAYTDACEATHVRGEQSAEVLDLRMSCLQGPLKSLRALTDIFIQADTDVLVEAPKAAAAMPAIDRCADIAGLRDAVPLPADPKARRRIEDLESRLAEVRALDQTGRWPTARQRAAPLVDDAKATGYKPLIAETLSLLGELENLTGDAEAAVRTEKVAFVAALAARNDEVAFRAASLLEMVLNYHLARYEDVQPWDDLASALLERMGPGHERSWAEFSLIRSGVAQKRGDFRSALSGIEQALAIYQEEVFPADAANAWNWLAALKIELEDPGGALVAIDKSLQIAGRVFGPESPQLAIQLMNRGEILEALGRHAEACDLHEEALRRWESWLAPDHVWLAYPLTGLGNALRSQGHVQEALTSLERALRIRERDEHSPQPLAETRFAVARALWDAAGGDRGRARALATAARDAYLSVSWTARAGHVQDWLSTHQTRDQSRLAIAHQQ